MATLRNFKLYFGVVLLLTFTTSVLYVTQMEGLTATMSMLMSQWTAPMKATNPKPYWIDSNASILQKYARFEDPAFTIPDDSRIMFSSVKNLKDNQTISIIVQCLTVISKGARDIYLSGGNLLPDKNDAFHYAATFRGLLYQGVNYFDPFKHFGQAPIGSSNLNDTAAEYVIGPWKTPAIQHGIFNGLSVSNNNHKKGVSKMTFDLSNPPTAARIGAYSPMLPFDTLFRYDALWAILLPKLNICSNVRDAMIQRLLWETGNILGFFPSNSSLVHEGGSRSHQSTCLQRPDLVKTVTEWRCDENKTFFLCIMDLSKKLKTQKYLINDDLNMIDAWLHDLRSVGYMEPSRVNYTKHEGTYGAIAVIDSKLAGQSDKSSPFVKTLFGPHIATITNRPPLESIHSISIRNVSQACKNVSTNVQNLLTKVKVKRYYNIVLVLVFNYPHYGNVPYLDLMYRPFFKHIVYCGTNKGKYMKDGYLKRATFIEANVHKGWLGYRCMIQVMRMNYDVEGYLHLGDDVLLNVWNLHTFPRDRLWIHSAYNLYNTRRNPGWYWSERWDVGRGRYNVAMKAASQLNQTKWEVFLKQLQVNTGSSERIKKGISDIMYMPKRLQSDALYFLEHFSKFDLFLEMTFPTVWGGLDKFSNIVRLPGKYVWGNNRNRIEVFFNKKYAFQHPLKLSSELKKPKGQKFFCGTFLPILYNGS